MHVVALVIAAPTFVAGYAYVGLMLALGLAHQPRIRGRLMPVAVWRAWWAKLWPYSTTVGRGVCLHPRHVDGGTDDIHVWTHERVHVRQHEDLACMGLVGALAVLLTAWGEPWAALTVWLGSQAAPLCGLLMSGLRNGWDKAYREAEHERAAYAQDGR